MRTCGTVSTVMVLCLVAQSSAIIEYRATIARGNRLTVRPSAGLKLPRYDVNTPIKGEREAKEKQRIARNGGSNPYKHVRWIRPIISVSIWFPLWVIKTLVTNFRWPRPVLNGRTIWTSLFAFRLCDTTSKLYSTSYNCRTIQAYTPAMSRLKITSKENKPILTTTMVTITNRITIISITTWRAITIQQYYWQ